MYFWAWLYLNKIFARINLENKKNMYWLRYYKQMGNEQM